MNYNISRVVVTTERESGGFRLRINVRRENDGEWASLLPSHPDGIFMQIGDAINISCGEGEKHKLAFFARPDLEAEWNRPR